MRFGRFAAAFLVVVLAGPALSAQIPEADFLATCRAAGQRIWGTSLCTPVVVVDPKTGRYRSSSPTPAEPLPEARANTAIDWAGEPWVMVLEPLPGDPAALRSLLFHEAWHSKQEELGFPPNNAVASHLEDPVARYLLRLEWTALEAALRSQGAARRRHVAQALAFRNQRLEGNPEAAKSERLQMRHEGLASYTGAALSGDPVRLALEGLRSGAKRPSLGRSFAYVSGPAWGLLLDAYRPDWRESGDSVDLPELIPIRSAAVARPDDYGGTALLSEETLAGFERESRIAAAMQATSPSGGLKLPLAQMSLDFDPNRVSTGPDGSSIYHRITLRDRWGQIRVEGLGLRIEPNFTVAWAPWPLPDGSLELAPGWRVQERPHGGAVLFPPS